MIFYLQDIESAGEDNPIDTSIRFFSRERQRERERERERERAPCSLLSAEQGELIQRLPCDTLSV